MRRGDTLAYEFDMPTCQEASEWRYATEPISRSKFSHLFNITLIRALGILAGGSNGK